MADGIVNPYDDPFMDFLDAAAPPSSEPFDPLIDGGGPSNWDKIFEEGEKGYEALLPPTTKDNKAGDYSPIDNYVNPVPNAPAGETQVPEDQKKPAEWVFEGPFDKALYDSIHDQDSLINSPNGRGAVGGHFTTSDGSAPRGRWAADGTWIPDTVNGTPESALVWKANKGGFAYRYPSKYGIRSRSPRSTPKYNQYLNLRHREFLQTTARMYISVKNPSNFVNEVGKGNQHLKAIARVLAGNNKVEESGKGYIDFLLLQANHALNEKVQVIETLSDNYVAFFFGQSAPIFQYSGMLMNSYQDDWAINMLRMYQSISRGSQLARRGVLFYLKYDSMVISGSILNLNWSLNGENELLVPFSFNLLVRKIHILYGGLEPPTDFTLDSSLNPLAAANAFWPSWYDPNESGKSGVNAKVHDDVGASAYGTGGGGDVVTPEPTAPVPETGLDAGETAAPDVPAPTPTTAVVAPGMAYAAVNMETQKAAGLIAYEE